MKLLAMLTAMLVFSACDTDDLVLGPEDGCEPEEMRCNGLLVETCGSDQRWVTSMDCEVVAELSGGVWECKPDMEAGPTCMPVEQEDAGNE